jgi:hypothetical protein
LITPSFNCFKTTISFWYLWIKPMLFLLIERLMFRYNNFRLPGYLLCQNSFRFFRTNNWFLAILSPNSLSLWYKES